MHRLGRKYIQRDNHFQLGTKHWLPSLLLFLEILLGPIAIYFLQHNSITPFETVVYTLFSLGMLGLFLSLVCLDPGVYPPLMGIPQLAERNGDKLDDSLANHTIHSQCDFCNHHRPLRSYHCASCNLCIEMFDHHCPYLNNCIGRRNHKRFVFFLFYTFVFLLFGVTTMV